jgi:hypothetical protein
LSLTLMSARLIGGDAMFTGKIPFFGLGIPPPGVNSLTLARLS